MKLKEFAGSFTDPNDPKYKKSEKEFKKNLLGIDYESKAKKKKKERNMKEKIKKIIEANGKMGGKGLGLGGVCICPKCGTKKKHERGKPCYKIKCPKCGTKMTRKS